MLTGCDASFKKLDFSESFCVDQFPRIVELEYQKFKLQFVIFDGEFFSDDITINFLSEELLLQHCGAILVISGYSFAVMCRYHLGEFDVFDSN